MPPRAGLIVRRISLVAFPGRDVQVGDCHVLVEQVAHRGGRLRLLTDRGLLQQPGQLGLGVLGCLGGGLEPDLLAGQRVSGYTRTR